MDRSPENRNELQDPRVDQVGGPMHDEDTEGLGGQRVEQQDREQDGREVHRGEPNQDRDMPVGQGEPGHDEGVDVGGGARAKGHEQQGKRRTAEEGWGATEPQIERNTEGLGADDGMVEPKTQGGDPSRTGEQQEERASLDTLAREKRETGAESARGPATQSTRARP